MMSGKHSGKLSLLKTALLTTTFLVASVLNFAARSQAPDQITTASAGSAEADKQRVLRRLRFGEREINLPRELDTAKLRVTNDTLEIDIAKREGSAPDVNRLEIDRYALAQRKVAVEVAAAFAQVWSRQGDPAAEARLEAAEIHFDDANDKCLARDDNHQLVKFETVEEAQSACADLQAIYVEIQGLHIATPDEWPSVFRDDPSFKHRLGYSFFTADTEQLRRDKTASLSTKDREWLVNKDQDLLGLDKQIWIAEIDKEDTTEFNARHSEDPLATVDELLDHMTNYRQEIATIVGNYRSAIHPSHTHAPSKRTAR